MKEEAKRFFETGMEKDFMNLSISEISARLDARLDRNKGIKINGIKYNINIIVCFLYFKYLINCTFI